MGLPQVIALEFDRVSKHYPTPDATTYRVVHEISLTIASGAFVAPCRAERLRQDRRCSILRRDSCRRTSGKDSVEGEPLVGLNRRATYMFQQDALLPWKNVRANVALGLTLAA